MPLISDAMDKDDPAAFREEPENTRVQLADVPQLEESVAESLRQWLTVVLAVPQSCQSGKHGRKVIRIARLERLQELAHWALSGFSFVELYREFHGRATSILKSAYYCD